MKLFFKIMLSLLLAVIIGVTLATVWIAYFFDLNQYKSMISRTIAEQSGYQVHFKGDLSWSVYPSLGLTVEEMDVLDKNHPDYTLMAVKKIHFSLNTRALWDQQIQITEILVKGLDVQIISGGPVTAAAIPKQKSLAVNHDITSASTQMNDQNESASSHAGTAENAWMQQLARTEIERLLIENSNVSLTDQTTGQTYRLSDIRLETAHIRLGEPVDLFISTQVTLPNEATMMIHLSTRIFVGPEATIVRLNPFKVVLDQDIFEGYLQLNRQQDPWAIEAVLKSDEFDFARFLKDSKKKITMKKIETQANLSFDRRVSVLEKALLGSVTLTAGELSFNGMNIADKAAQLDQLRRMFINEKADWGALLNIAKKVTETSYSAAKTTVMQALKLKNKVKDAVIFSDVEVTGPGYVVFGKGNIGFDQRLDFALSIGLPELQAKNLPTLVIPLQIKGTVSEPEISLLEKELTKQLEVVMKARIKDEVQDQIVDQAKGFLKNLGR